MYPNRDRKMCHTPREELDRGDYNTRTERSMSTGSEERWTRFKDGTSTWHNCMGEDLHYDEYGEEC